MQLSVKDLSKLLNVAERTIYRWIKQKSIPFYRIHDQYRFNRIEILDWVTAQKINISQNIFHDADENDIAEFSLTETIKKGGIYYRVEGKDKKSLLGSVIDLLSLPDDVKKEDLLNAMLVREELGSTGLGDGIAIPHARYPVVVHIPYAIVSICFLEKPIDYDAIDGKPVNCLFTLVSPTVRSHLKMLSRIAYVLKNTDVKEILVRQKSREVILSEIEKAEQFLNK
ncbi:MAG: PTS sugar transporter subunit IIA [Candidatus Omnitrophota bacterium]|nr:PTS sugar transporter subunit IIA [Candidatus Omnitrophota bacterium]MBU1894920.1 PTS sugar transporter subunit IIA [Candidatus Omnitrophota bacterium]